MPSHTERPTCSGPFLMALASLGLILFAAGSRKKEGSSSETLDDSNMSGNVDEASKGPDQLSPARSSGSNGASSSGTASPIGNSAGTQPWTAKEGAIKPTNASFLAPVNSDSAAGRGSADKDLNQAESVTAKPSDPNKLQTADSQNNTSSKSPGNTR